MVTAFNGIVYGGSFSPVPNASPINGKMKLLLYESQSFLSIPTSLRNYKHGQLDKLGKAVRLLDCADLTVKMTGNRKMYFAADGEVFDLKEHGNSYSLRVLPTALKFVVPQGVALKEQCRDGEGE